MTKKLALCCLMSFCLIALTACFQAEKTTVETSSTQQNFTANLSQHLAELQDLREEIHSKVSSVLQKIQTFAPADDHNFKKETLNLPLKNGLDQEVSSFVEDEQELFRKLAQIKEKLGHIVNDLHTQLETKGEAAKAAFQGLRESLTKEIELPDLEAEMKKIEDANIIYAPIEQHENTLRMFLETLTSKIDQLLPIVSNLNKD